MPTSTLDIDVRTILANKDHSFALFVAPGSEPNWEYCQRCGRKKEDLKLLDGKYLDCRGFVG